MKEVSPAIRAIPALPVFLQVLEKSRYRISPIAGPMGDFGSLDPTALRHRIASWFAHFSVQSFHFAFILLLRIQFMGPGHSSGTLPRQLLEPATVDDSLTIDDHRSQLDSQWNIRLFFSTKVEPFGKHDGSHFFRFGSEPDFLFRRSVSQYQRARSGGSPSQGIGLYIQVRRASGSIVPGSHQGGSAMGFNADIADFKNGPGNQAGLGVSDDSLFKTVEVTVLDGHSVSPCFVSVTELYPDAAGRFRKGVSDFALAQTAIDPVADQDAIFKSSQNTVIDPQAAVHTPIGFDCPALGTTTRGKGHS